MRLSIALTALTALTALALSAAAPAPRFPAPLRPVSPIVSPSWSDEASREDDREAATVIRLAGVRAGMRVADIGAGAGYYTLKLSSAVGPQGEVIAEDIVPAYTKALGQRIADKRLGNIHVALGAPDDARLAAGSIDRAFLVHMYHEIAQPYALMWRLHASLRPGAEVAIVDADRGTGEHGTPPRLLACEMAAVGYRETSFTRDIGSGGYLALFVAQARPAIAAIKACR